MPDHSARIDVIDGAKGIGISLVVFGHAWRGAELTGIIPQQSATFAGDANLFRAVDALIYSFHMPLFFFLSGLLFLETLRKQGTVPLVRGRITRLLWPMALWTWLFFGLKLLAGDRANGPVSITDFPLIPLPPFEHLWFLWALFLIQLLLIVVHRVGLREVPAQAVRWIAAVWVVALLVVSPLFSVPSLIWGPMLAHVPYFLAGIAAGAFLRWQPGSIICLFALGMFLVLLWLVQGNQVSAIHSLALVLSVWVCFLGGLKAGPLLRVLVVLGQGSMAIYLMHTIFSAALRIAMREVGFDGFVSVVAATTLVGLLLPLVVLAVARRLRVIKVLGL
ncbi:acyltransferase family protein [Sulfitobacter guttiformis]|uniref:Fucose 4-O-acetylase-like acetyltransferase n=1 Tax=Sulfitobacter guttiformis TaxID=74349 RepID=A0A420DQE5_9RHOB|nr:acyltransferase [Sulfitobacter guttiformis]KIN73853.1 Acyltransferase [Sulfitobacter guttiformis KCTC 32187]RKE96485.1 fucose 4-O-acetylase-like acetyltransferase [Sulfitobacter guttiformis]